MWKEKYVRGSFEDGMGLGRAGPENRVRGAGRQAQARYYETAAGNVDPTLGIVKTLLS